MQDFDAFGRAERAGWSDPDRVSGYVDLFAPAADQAIDALLESGAAAQGAVALDLCCGQGNVTEALVARGCATTGLDFSAAMIDRARARVPDADFRQGDAQSLPFEDGSFDIVVSNFGLCHVPDQQKALSEVRRVLRPGGRFAMTVWCGPDISPSFEIVYGAVKTHGSPEVTAPAGPDFHQFADPATAAKLLTAAGFAGIGHRVVPCVWRLESPEAFFRVYARGTVRAAMLFAAQPPHCLEAIRAAMSDQVRGRYAEGDVWVVPVPAALISAAAG
jgi:SAM-dependent methyltransferase